MYLAKIRDVTPHFLGYDNYPKDDSGKIILPRINYSVNGKDRSVIVIYRKNVIDYGNGLIGLCDSSKIANESWVALRDCFILEEDNGTQKFYWCIGGSDSGAITGVSPYANARMIYETKTSGIHLETDAATAFRFEFGHINEELIARGFATLNNMKVVKNSTVFFREDIGFMQANIDFMVEHTDNSWSVLEIKTVNDENVTVLNDYRNGIVPPYYITQGLLHYCHVLSAAFNIRGAFFAVLYNNNLNKLFRIQKKRNPDDERTLLEAEQEFETYLRFQTPPPLNGCVKAEKLISLLRNEYPVALPDKKIALSKESVQAAQDLITLQEEISLKEKELERLSEKANKLRLIIIEEMKDAERTEGFVDVNGEMKYISYSNTSRTNINKNILQDKYPEVYREASYTISSRRFYVKKDKKGGKK